MKKSALSQYVQGSAEAVVAHAQWRRSRGRAPSMSFVGERNPRKALFAAKCFIASAKQADLFGQLGKLVMRHKRFNEMNDVEIEAAVRHIVTSSSSEAEVRQRLRDELGYPYSDVCLRTLIPGDATGREMRELVRGLGGLVMKNGAMAMVIIQGHEDVIDL